MILGVETLEDRAVPATFTVANTNDAGAGSLRAAITDGRNHSDNDITILFTFPETEGPPPHRTITLDSDLPQLNKNFTIVGLGWDKLTVRRNPAAANFAIFDVVGGSNCSISGMEITNGREKVNGLGGAILNTASLTLTNCFFENNFATQRGGAIYSTGTLNMTSCYVVGNTSNDEGGGIWSSGTTTITGSTVEDNTATRGGGIFVYDGICRILSSSSIDDNAAEVEGGGIYVRTCSEFTMSGGLIEFNRVTGEGGGDARGGGIYFAAGWNLTLTDVDILSNHAEGTGAWGGGFYIAAGLVTFNNVDISGNTATVLGAGGAWKAPGSYAAYGGPWVDQITEEP